MIRRVLIAEPHGGDASHAEWIRSRLLSDPLVDTAGQQHAELTMPRDSKSVCSLYVGDSQSWESVTPVVLPGYDEGKQGKAERLFLKAVRQAGLPTEAVAELTLRKAPFGQGRTIRRCIDGRSPT